MPMLKNIKWLLAGAIVAGATLMTPAQALAETRITLNDGTVLVGEIIREGDEFVFLKVQIGAVDKQEFIRRADIAKLERDYDAAEGDEATEQAVDENAQSVIDSGPVLRGEKEKKVIPPGATRIAFVSLEEMVGTYFNTDALKRSVDYLKALPEDEKPEILVIKINSGGGFLVEQHRIISYIRDEVKPYFRTVAWIESAISAACMTSWVTDEIYMMRKAPLGGCVGFSSTSSGTVAMDGRGLEEELHWMEQVSREGKRDYRIMRAMQVYATLSCDIDEDGNVTWYLNDQGEYLVSPPNEVLTLNSYDAVKYKVAEGVADSKQELAEAMGCTEWVEVGTHAEETMVEFREAVKLAEIECIALDREMQIALNAMRRTPELRNKKRHFGTARKKFRQLRNLVFEKATSFRTYSQFNDDYFDNWERYLDEIAEQLADA